MSERSEPASQNSWQDLFSGGATLKTSLQLKMRVLKKRGRPFLLLPAEPRSAAACLDLYPAQTPRARIARGLLRFLLRAAMPVGAQKISLTISPEDRFVRFLASLAGQKADSFPHFGILAGNPATPGRRFLLLLFGADHKPAVVVKAGITEAARSLIREEHTFLAVLLSTNLAGLPKLRSGFSSARLRAVALSFSPGDSPRPRHESALPALLGSWVIPTKTMPLSETPPWSRLEKAASAEALRSIGAPQLRDRVVHSVIQHGDFAPWNIKVSPQGAWTVLDWERGELEGIPAWDWFHYLIQPAILVQHEPTSVLVERLGQFLASAPFKEYAEQTAITGLERPLLLAYLLHMISVIQPSEGLPQTRALLSALLPCAHGTPR